MLRRNNTVLALLSSARTSRMTLSERSRNCTRYCMVAPVRKRRGAAANHDLTAAISTNHLQRGAGGSSPSPQVLASEPLIEDGGFASRSLDSCA